LFADKKITPLKKAGITGTVQNSNPRHCFISLKG
jgi:hypothetical protein